MYQDFTKRREGEKEQINDDIIFEIELIRQVEINIDYILMMVAKYHDSNCKDKEILVDIRKAIEGTLQLRSKRQLIEEFISSVNASSKVDEDWRRFVQQRKEEEIASIISEEKLKPEETRKLIDSSLRDGVLKTTGTDIDRIMPPVSRFGSGNRTATKQTIIERLKGFFEKYFGIV